MQGATGLEAVIASLPGDRPRLLFALFNPGHEPRRVPVPIGPPGYLVRLQIFDHDRLVWESRPVKVKRKLDPAWPRSYRDLDPDILHGTVYELDELHLEPGAYRVEALYSNGPYQGPTADPIGEIALSADTELRIG